MKKLKTASNPPSMIHDPSSDLQSMIHDLSSALNAGPLPLAEQERIQSEDQSKYTQWIWHVESVLRGIAALPEGYARAKEVDVKSIASQGAKVAAMPLVSEKMLIDQVSSILSRSEADQTRQKLLAKLLGVEEETEDDGGRTKDESSSSASRVPHPSPIGSPSSLSESSPTGGQPPILDLSGEHEKLILEIEAELDEFWKQELEKYIKGLKDVDWRVRQASATALGAAMGSGKMTEPQIQDVVGELLKAGQGL
ncbi:MAG: hypothetical protein HYS08_03655, partial [Chlamydiae bacterium]|nr:hypothetical protein [Chlamydiota bacterium]